MKGILALLLVAVAFAGCSDDPADDPEGPAPSEPSNPGSSNGTAPPAPAGPSAPPSGNTSEPSDNTPPTAGLSASIEQGPVPVNVTFDLSGADSDGDLIEWSFDADGDGSPEASGSALPDSYEHSYPEAGEYDARLTVSDGQASTEANVTINATAAIANEGPVQSVSGEWTGGPSGCFQTIVIGDLATIENLRFDVDSDSIGRSFVADYTAGPTAQRFYLIFWTEEIDVAAEFESTDGHIEGVVPPDAHYARAATCLGGPTSFTYAA